MTNVVLEYFITHMEANPLDFQVNGYQLTHIPSDINIWVGDGMFSYFIYCNIDGARVSLSLAESIKFHRAYERWAKAYIEAELLRRVTKRQ